MVKSHPAHFFAQSISACAGKWIGHFLTLFGLLAVNKAEVFRHADET
jgi:hypothetical protein